MYHIILIQLFYYTNKYKFYATTLKVILTLFTILFLQIFFFMILQHDIKSQVV